MGTYDNDFGTARAPDDPVPMAGIPDLHYIVNLRTMEYKVAVDESFDGEWKKRYSHVADSPWDEVEAFHLWDPFGREYEHNGKRYVICWTENLDGPNGMNFIILQTPDIPDEVAAMLKADLRKERDVVSMKVYKLKEAS